jgi:hypothetical protein
MFTFYTVLALVWVRGFSKPMAMNQYNSHDSTSADAPDRATATLVSRVSQEERVAVTRLAHAHDRTPSREVRRAIRFYLTNFDLADRLLREQAEKEQL